MPRVTDIQTQKNGRFYSIFVDGKFSFSLGDLELSASAIRVGGELSLQEVAEWQRSSGQSKIRNRALAYLAIRPRSAYEVEQYLRRKDVADEDVSQTIAWLTQLNYLDDADFAKRWVEHRRSGSQRSNIRIAVELRQKGVDQQLIEEALGGDSEDQLAVLKELIQKRRHKYADEHKLIQYLARQGYGWGQIKTALAEIKESD